jgi:hypothetical protein
MHRFYLIWQKASSLAFFLAFWLSLHAGALAAPTKVVPTSGGNENSQSWVTSYILVLVAVGLGMLVVCRTSRRSDCVKPTEYQGQANLKS